MESETAYVTLMTGKHTPTHEQISYKSCQHNTSIAVVSHMILKRASLPLASLFMLEAKQLICIVDHAHLYSTNESY